MINAFIEKVKRLHPSFEFDYHEPFYSSFRRRILVITTSQNLSVEIDINELTMSNEYINSLVNDFNFYKENLNAQTKK